MKTFLLAFLLAFSLTLQAQSRKVMTWIPVYGANTCKTLINDATKSQWLKDGITHIGLQFWVPGDNGAVVFATDYMYQYKAATIEQDVQDFVTWGHNNGVKVMMCFYNIRDTDFDWALTQEVINTYPSETTDTIIKLVNHYGLDGVDIDFEGIGNYTSDKPAFVNFLDMLGDALHLSGKELSVDMFSTPCYNAPNTSWESAMAPHVNFMNIMGYSDTYEDNNTLFSSCPRTPSEANSYAFKYSYIENFLTVKQGVASSKLCYGLPSWVDNWGGQCLMEHILDINDISSAGGIAIWDMQLGAGGYWTDPDAWELIKMFKNGSTSDEIREQLPICGVTTAVSAATGTADIYYDTEHQLLNLSGMSGELRLYSSMGTLEKTILINAGETPSLADLPDGLHIIQFQTSSGVYNAKIIK